MKLLLYNQFYLASCPIEHYIVDIKKPDQPEFTDHIAGSVQYSHMRHFGEIVFVFVFFENITWHIILAHFHNKILFKISKMFVKFKKQNVVHVRMNFPGFVKKKKKKKQRKSYLPHTTFFEFWLLFKAPFLLRIFL